MDLSFIDKKSLILIALAISLAGVSGCAAPGATRRVPLDSVDPFSTAGTESSDLRGVCQKMASSILSVDAILNAAEPPRVAFAVIDRRTDEFLDDAMFLEKIRTNLIKFSEGKIQFLDRSISEQIERERAEKRSGERQGAEKGAKYGADYFLTGTIASIPRGEGNVQTVYTRYAFRLVDAETELVVWEDDYETKKLGRTPAWMR